MPNYAIYQGKYLSAPGEVEKKLTIHLWRTGPNALDYCSNFITRIFKAIVAYLKRQRRKKLLNFSCQPHVLSYAKLQSRKSTDKICNQLANCHIIMWHWRWNNLNEMKRRQNQICVDNSIAINADEIHSCYVIVISAADVCACLCKHCLPTISINMN